MPLIAQLLPARDGLEESRDPSSFKKASATSQAVAQDQDSGYEDFHDFDEDDGVDSDMEGSIMHRRRPRKNIRAPALPQRSQMRTSKVLESVILELKTLEANVKEQGNSPAMEHSDPHEHYLSSEEDSSLSDDYEDYLSDLEGTSAEGASDTELASSRPSSRKSQEVTAIAVSFHVVGKPHIVEIPVSQHNSPQSAKNQLSINLDTLPTFNSLAEPPKKSLLRRPAPLNLRDSAFRDSQRMSTCSVASSTISPTSTSYSPSLSSYIPSGSSYIPSKIAPSPTVLNYPASLPPRKSSRLAVITSMVVQTKNTLQTSVAPHSFLNSDPFASPPTKAKTEVDTPITPKTPTSMAATAFKRGFQRTLSRARKTSMPKISLAYTAGVVAQRPNPSQASVLAPVVKDTAPTASETGSARSSVENRVVEQTIGMVKRSETMPVTPSDREGAVCSG